MNKLLRYIQITSLTIFAMLFGAGNLIFPIRLGVQGGTSWPWAFLGFCLTGVLVPVIGLLGIVAFEGDYIKFFNRTGKWTGPVLVLISLIIIGPCVVMPRIVAFSYEMLRPFLPSVSLFVYSIAMLGLVFSVSFRKETLLAVIGKILSPLKICAVLFIIAMGLWYGQAAIPSQYSISNLLMDGIVSGYQTLDLIAAIFFGSMIFSLLKMYSASRKETLDRKTLMKIAGIGGLGGGLLLALVYGGLCALSAYNGHGLSSLNEGRIFSAISFRVLGVYGAAIMGFIIFLACFVTIITLSGVTAEYVQKTLSRSKLSYTTSLIINLVITAVIAQLGLAKILNWSLSFITFLYPIFIVITLCNILYAFWHFKPIKVPVLVMFLIISAIKLIAYSKIY
ncbi:MAG: hypothetical protein UU47_C0027G0006 [candidate division TM6 bacterium GW2011_GWE2_41_16]|nr:MAG: hypothetical protein UU47_C0027G0006 [candidate division TM6 bacterium GW2011_GWE2_41_16]